MSGAPGRRVPGGLVALLAVLALLAAWEAWARASASSALLFPAPSAVAAALLRLGRSGELLGATAATLGRLFAGLLLGGVPALLLGLFMGWSPRVRAAVDPLVAAAHAVPKIAVFPILMMLLGIGEAPKVALVAAAAFFPLLIDTMSGVRQISPIHFEVARACGASAGRVFRRVLLPGSLPQVLSGLRLSFHAALLITVALEFVAARTGLGATIWLAWQTMRVEDLFAAVAVLALLGAGFNAALARAARLLVPWHATPEI